jgi:hypothetical protein
MSCIRFNTEAQMKQLKSITADDGAVAQWLSPGATDSKIARIRAMAKDKNSKIRESAALSIHLPEDVAFALATDKSANVRACLARNESTPQAILRELSDDKSPTVRSWVAVNFFTPADVIKKLASDEDEQVRQLVQWKNSANSA